MFFFNISAEIPVNQYKVTGEDERKFAKTISRSAAAYNKKHPDTYFVFVNSSECEISVSAISRDSVIDAKQAAEFIESLGIKHPDKVEISETTLDRFFEALNDAFGQYYTDKRALEVLRLFDIDQIISNNYHEDMDYDEYLIEPGSSKDELMAEIDKSMSSRELKKELNRIYSAKVPAGVSGHPVHYLVGADGESTGNKINSILLEALYSNGRIKSRKYCHISFNYNGTCGRDFYEALYKSCTGGAVVVSYKIDSDSEETNHAKPELYAVNLICDVMMKYRHSVLTILNLPRCCENTKKKIYENLIRCSIVEIHEDPLSVGKARKYLKSLAAERKVTADRKLYAELESDKTYLTAELNKMHENWYDTKLRNSIYPQYKKTSCNKEEYKARNNRGCACDELNNMIGLTKAKETITKALNYYKIRRMYRDMGVMQEKAVMHMVFTGNPGTAKTSVARLFASIMRENGILSSGHLVEVGRADLVGKYVGWTAQIVKQKFRQASGGVLFIDEAYALVDDENGSYGEEAINTIVQEMENKRDDLIVIFAGYPDEMKEYLDTNPGLRSRIAFHVEFPDYTTEELCEIAKSIGNSRGLTLSDKAVEKLAVLFDSARTESDFGNGRFVRNVIEQSQMNLASRVIEMNPDDVTKKILTTIEADDVIIPEIKKVSDINRRRIGFTV